MAVELGTPGGLVSNEVEFGLLGPLDVRVGDRPLLVRSPKYRILLAALLVEPGRLVPTAELIEAIWGSHTPDSPRRTLQVYVTRVRTILLDAGAPSLISTGADGYRADVAPDQVDVTRFRDWLAQADRAADRSDLAAEQTALARATALWRGEPLADVPSDFLDREYGYHLAERRLQALERRIDLSLRAGRHVEAADELVRLTAQHPLREKLWAQLITALDRDGRRADALNAYHLMRRRLAAELGVEPGAELRELHASVLGGGAAAPAGRAGLPVPRQLPAEVVAFTGRAAQLHRMSALLDEHETAGTHATVVLTGMAGVGKTALAVHWSRRVADRFPDGQLWLDLRGCHHRTQVSPEQALTYVLRAFGVQGPDLPTDLDSQAGLYRSLMDGRRMLVVLDDAGSVEQLRPLLPGGPGSLVLVTSRHQLAGLVALAGAETVRVDPVSTAEARRMLVPRVGRQWADARHEQDAVDRIVARCGGLPLALAVVAARAVATPGCTPAVLDRRLGDARRPLDGFALPDARSDLRTVFSWSYQALDPPAARLFRLLGTHPTTELSTRAAAAVAGDTGVRTLLDELAAVHLVTETAPDRFTLHDLVHAYATELATEHEDPRERSAARRRLVRWLAGTAFHARSLIQPSETDVAAADLADAAGAPAFITERQARAWFTTEHRNLLAGVDLAHTNGFDDVCWRLAYAIRTQLYVSRAWDDMLRTHETGLRSAERSGDRRGQAHMLAGIGSAYLATGRTGLAVNTQQQALAMFRDAGDALGTARALSNLGAAYRRLGRFEDALTCFTQAYESDHARAEPGNMALSLYHIGLTLTAAGRPSDALPRICESLYLLRTIGHRGGEARALQALATAHARLGRHGAATGSYQAAANLYQETADHWRQAATLTEFGDALHEARRFRKSRDVWTRALAIYEELGAPDGAALRAKLAIRSAT